MADQNELWPLPHNWRDDWEESYEFKTEIITSRDQSEQRRALRALPRVRYRFLSTLLDERGRPALARLAARQAQSFVIPHARLFTTITNTIAAGTVAYTWDTDEDWGAVGRDVVFVRPDKTVELAELATYAAGAGNLVDTAIADIPAGSKVYLGIRGRFDKAAALRFLTNAAADFKGQFLADPGDTYRIPAGADVTTYNTRPVWLQKPNWAKPPDLRWDQFQDVIDFGFGVRDFVDPVDYVKRRINATYLIRDQASQDALYGFFVRRTGQRKSFYMPSWVKEFDVTAITTTTMTVAGTEVDTLFSTDPSHKHIVLFLPNDVRVYAEVASIAAAGGESVLTFRSAISPVTLSDISFATWLLPCRLASDRIAFKWVTGSVAPVTIPVQTIRDTLFWGAP